MSGPSEKAIEAAQLHAVLRTTTAALTHDARKAVEAAHDPALGLDRSVCLRDVIACLDRYDGSWDEGELVDFVQREFGGGS